MKQDKTQYKNYMWPNVWNTIQIYYIYQIENINLENMTNYTFIVKPFLAKSYISFEKPILHPYFATKKVNQSLPECNK